MKPQQLVIENEGALGGNAKSFKETIGMIPGVPYYPCSTRKSRTIIKV